MAIMIAGSFVLLNEYTHSQTQALKMLVEKNNASIEVHNGTVQVSLCIFCNMSPLQASLAFRSISLTNQKLHSQSSKSTFGG